MPEEKCDLCHGRRTILIRMECGGPTSWETCPECIGSGKFTNRCSVCKEQFDEHGDFDYHCTVCDDQFFCSAPCTERHYEQIEHDDDPFNDPEIRHQGLGGPPQGSGPDHYGGW